MSNFSLPPNSSIVVNRRRISNLAAFHLYHVVFSLTSSFKLRPNLWGTITTQKKCWYYCAWLQNLACLVNARVEFPQVFIQYFILIFQKIHRFDFAYYLALEFGQSKRITQSFFSAFSERIRSEPLLHLAEELRHRHRHRRPHPHGRRRRRHSHSCIQTSAKEPEYNR